MNVLNCKTPFPCMSGPSAGSLFVYMVDDVKEIKTVQNGPFKENWSGQPTVFVKSYIQYSDNSWDNSNLRQIQQWHFQWQHQSRWQKKRQPQILWHSTGGDSKTKDAWRKKLLTGTEANTKTETAERQMWWQQQRRCQRKARTPARKRDTNLNMNIGNSKDESSKKITANVVATAKTMSAKSKDTCKKERHQP